MCILKLLSLLGRSIGAGWFLGPTGVLLGSEGDLVQHELRDWVGEFGSHRQEVRLGLEAVLVSHVLDEDGGAVRSGVAVFSSLNDSAIRAGRRARLGQNDAVGGLYIEVVSSIILLEAVVPKDEDLLTGVGTNIKTSRLFVFVLGGGEGHGGHTSEDHL